MTTTNKFAPLGVAHLCGELKVIQEPAAQHVATTSDRPDAAEYARLFAAAPDLLEALIAVMHSKDRKGTDLAIAAIAKATGEQS